MIDISHNCAVIFRGELVAGSNAESVKEKLMAAFSLNRPQVEKLLANNSTILKRGLSTDQAARYLAAMKKLGLICHVAKRNVAPEAQAEVSSNKVETSATKSAPPVTGDKTQREAGPATKLTPQMIETAFRGEFKAVAIDRKYMAAITATAILMLLLPMVYIGITFMIGYWTFWHIFNNLTPVTGIVSGVIAGVLYFVPIVVGFTLLLFLVKPLFAHPTVKRRPITLDPVRHRRFFHFVECICAEIGAPRPCEIHVDGYVNASARLKYGIFSNQLILTVGMPLVMGLNTRELAGVLAHEFGHFAQHYAMKLGYLINTINFWFYRVVNERDSWDEYLDQWLENNENIYINITGHCAHLCIRLTRGLLHGLMLVGILASRYMSRQMEFDADIYEARLAGSQQFKRTTLAIRLLSSAFADAQRRNSSAWNEGHITDNLPKLAANIATTLPAASRQSVNNQMKSTGSQRWATHPTDAERIERAELESCDGIFQLELPAYLLLHDHERLNKQTTLNYYQNEGIRISDVVLVAPEKILETATNRSEGQATLERYFNGQFQAGRVLPITGSLDHPPKDMAQLQTLVDELRHQTPEAKSLVQQYEETEARLAWLRVAYAYLESDIPLDPRTFNLPSSDKSVVDEALSRTLAEYRDREAKLRHHEKVMGQRLSLAVALAYSQSDTSAQQQLTTLWRALQGLGKIRETFAGLLCYGFVLGELYAYGDAENNRSHQTCKSYIRLCNREIEHIHSVMSHYRDPFANNEEGTLAQLLQQWIDDRRGNAQNEIEICLNTKQALIEVICYLNGRITGALAVYAIQAERLTGLSQCG